MDHATAVKIAQAYKPELEIDDQHSAIPDCLVLRHEANDIPFSIHLPTDLKPHDPDAPAREEILLKLSLDAAAKHFGI